MRTHAFTDITGNRYERLVVIQRLPNKNGRMRWLCQCDCGQTTEARGEHLKNLRIRSCGCLDMERMTTHGLSRTIEYKTWQKIRLRCQNPKDPSYQYYGARGIKVCERWDKSFEAFYQDMGPKPEGKYSIDRYPDNNGNYEPGNCRWATDNEQIYNRRNTLLATIEGVTKPVKKWCEELSVVSYQTVRMRIKAGWNPEHAIKAGARATSHA
jgi:hypothetical protein